MCVIHFSKIPTYDYTVGCFKDKKVKQHKKIVNKRKYVHICMLSDKIEKHEWMDGCCLWVWNRTWAKRQKRVFFEAV